MVNKSKLSHPNLAQIRNQVQYSQRRTRILVDQVISQANLVDNRNPQPKSIKGANLLDNKLLKIVFLGGQDGIGSKNMVVIEYGKDAIVIDCGHDLGLDLPGINYAIPDISYLKTIKAKLRGYVLTHGHLDHIGALPHVIPLLPAPIYGSNFTIGMAQKILANQPQSADLVNKLQFVVMNMDNHQQLVLGDSFKVELVRVTHSIPESSLVVVETPVGRVVHTGDYRLDPEPLDRQPTDIARLKQIGRQGVLALLSESTNSQLTGRVPTEHTLQASFDDIMAKTNGRLFVASFSSNINRIQMIINSAVRSGRKIAIDGRSMIQQVELSVKLGLIKIPQGTIVSVANLANLPDNKLLLVCTGAQGEIGASLQRMSVNDHKYINLKAGDTVVISSKPIPGNETACEKLNADLVDMGCKVYKATTWEVDGGCGPLHVSGHGYRDEQREMIELTQPQYLVPIYAAADHRQYHAELAQQETKLTSDQILMIKNGDLLTFNHHHRARVHSQVVPWGSILIDDSGQVVPSVVIKDRLMLTASGLVVIVLTINSQAGGLLCSPDIITRGFIHIRDNEKLMNLLRTELKRAVNQRFGRIGIDSFKNELKDHISNFLFKQTQRSPIIIPVVNVVTSKPGAKTNRQQAKMQGAIANQIRHKLRS